MKLPRLPSEQIKSLTSEQIQNLLLEKVMKIKKLNREMKDDVHVQKAEDTLMLAKAPFKKLKNKWENEVSAFELELKTRKIDFNVHYDDIYGDDK